MEKKENEAKRKNSEKIETQEKRIDELERCLKAVLEAFYKLEKEVEESYLAPGDYLGHKFSERKWWD